MELPKEEVSPLYTISFYFGTCHSACASLLSGVPSGSDTPTGLNYLEGLELTLVSVQSPVFPLFLQQVF